MLGTLKQLAYLDVSKNNLEMVDEKISGCENLQDLLLSNNALTQLPGSIGEDYGLFTPYSKQKVFYKTLHVFSQLLSSYLGQFSRPPVWFHCI